jgi:hypothetical protein
MDLGHKASENMDFGRDLGSMDCDKDLNDMD